MHLEVLTDSQLELLDLVKDFSGEFGLVGGTAVALQIGHRRSVDFDLITLKKLQSDKVRNTIREKYEIRDVLIDNPVELTLVVKNVKFTFLHYPFNVTFSEKLEKVISLPDVVTLSAMKAYALGRRAKWKDYVDLFFIFKKHSLREVTKKAEEIFEGEFNEKLFREQLSYYKDIDYSEVVNYLSNFEISDTAIRESLKEISVQK